MELERCPYCGETARLVSIQNGFAIVCNDKNCLGQMQIHFESCNNEEIREVTDAALIQDVLSSPRKYICF